MRTPTQQADLTLGEFAAAFSYAHDLLRNPSPDQHRWLHSHECSSVWRELAERFDKLSGTLDVPVSHDDFATRFIATFDVGAPTPPVPLIESHYNHREPVPRILHENILFFRQFGLQLRESAQENADHIRYQLEFASYVLAELAHGDPNNGEDRCDQLRRAFADYTQRHMISWIPQAAGLAVDAPLTMGHQALVLVTLLIGTSVELVRLGHRAGCTG